ncbi:DNA mismatch endonuclease Vsr [Candidatus Sumerlaeota bacterium]|nr:DNA mismatch endonuclease Vsr [Candidatus Sumerlaeota bacterium]
MVDHVTRRKRSEIMSAVQTRNTGPEVRLRSLLHRAGYRFRIDYRRLPGRPDIALPGRRKLIFVHGCFWHGHKCKYGRLPKSNLAYWKPKIAANRRRDKARMKELTSAGWKVLVAWQCELRDEAGLMKRVRSFLGKPSVKRK